MLHSLSYLHCPIVICSLPLVLASSGIDYDIKLWAPIRLEPHFDKEKVDEVGTITSSCFEKCHFPKYWQHLKTYLRNWFILVGPTK